MLLCSHRHSHHHVHHRHRHHLTRKSTMFVTRPLLLLIVVYLLLVLAIAATPVGADYSDRCSSSSSSSTTTQFECPNVEACPESGISLVDDCLDCPGHLNTDFEGKQCFNRHLLSTTQNPNPSYFWRDLIGMIVWFVAAGVATACGVGGGGIYVPLGILLLAFAPKPSSGLSQASIFGASLGGLILNTRNTHPFTTKVVVVGGEGGETNEVESTTTTTTTRNGGGGGGEVDCDRTEATAPHEEGTIKSSSPPPSIILEEAPAPTPAAAAAPTVNGPATAEVITCIATDDKTPVDTTAVHYYTRPLIDYDMALFLAPMEMAGAVLGVLIQKILPNWLYLTLSAVILAYTAKKTYGKWWETRKKERVAHEAAVETQQEEDAAAAATAAAAREPQKRTGTRSSSVVGGATGPESITTDLDDDRNSVNYGTAGPGLVLLPATTGRSSDDGEDDKADDSDNLEMMEEQQHDGNSGDQRGGQDYEIMEDATLTPEQVARRTELLERDARQYPREKLLTFFVLWIGLTLLTFFKGGKGVDSLVGITCSDPWYGVLIALQFVWTFGFAAFFGWKLMRQTKEKKAVHYPFHPQDVMWDFGQTRFYAFFTFVAGIVAGLIGIGGGMVLGPLMLVMGIHPRVSTATTATMIVLTSSSVAILFVTSGLVPWQYAVTFFSVCFVGAYIGKTYIDGYVKRTGKASILVFLLATIIAFATVGTLVIVLTRLAEADWCFAGFNQFCKPPTEDADVTCKTTERLLWLQHQYGSHFVSDVMG